MVTRGDKGATKDDKENKGDVVRDKWDVWQTNGEERNDIQVGTFTKCNQYQKIITT